MRAGILSLVAIFFVGLFVFAVSHDRPASALSQDVAFEGAVVRVAMVNEFKQRHEQYGVTCADCHGAEMDFTVTPPMQQCFACYESYDAVAERTAHLVPNPHHSHMGEVTCTDCHSEHGESRLSCNQCHVFDMDVP